MRIERRLFISQLAKRTKFIKFFRNQVRRLRFNNFDRGSLPPSDSEKFYEAYVQLGKIIDDENFAFKKRLPPGTILFVDNFRVMHGRTAFDGKRTVSGCYLRSAYFKFFEILKKKFIIIFCSRDDWISCARRENLLPQFFV